MATLLKFQATTTVPSAGPATTYRDLLVGGVSNVQLLQTDLADGPAERPFRQDGTGPAISFYSERVASDFTLSGNVTFQLSGYASDAGFTGRFRVRLSKVTHGGSDVETYIGMADATADFTTTTTLFSFAAITPSPAILIAANERLIVRVSVIPTGASSSFGTGYAVHRYNLISSGMTLTETVSFLPNGSKLMLRRTANTGIGTFRDLSETQGTTVWAEARTPTQAGGTEIQWVQQEPIGTINVTEITAAAIASTSNATSYVSASFTPVANRLYLLSVAHTDADPETTVPTVTSTTGLTFVQAGSSVGFNTVASPGSRLTMFHAMKPSGLSAGTYTVNFGDAATGCAAILSEVTGINTTGTDGSAAIRDVTTYANVGADPEMLNTVPPRNGPLEFYNGLFACFGSTLTSAPTPGPGYTGLSTRSYSTPSLGLFAEWRPDNDIRLSSGQRYARCTLASSNWGVIQAELVAAQTSAAAIEWISPRVKQAFYFEGADHCAGKLATSIRVNDGNAQCGVRVKLFHRAPNGAETLIYTNSSTVEMTSRTSTTTPPSATMDDLPWTPTTGTLNAAKVFAEDDRFVLRAYVINLGGTMAAGYLANLAYDESASDPYYAFYDAYVTLYPATTFKLESDPPRAMHVEGGMTMGGVGN